MGWGKFTRREIIADKDEQALNEQYDRGIIDFHKKAQITEGNIGGSFEENSFEKLFEID